MILVPMNEMPPSWVEAHFSIVTDSPTRARAACASSRTVLAGTDGLDARIMSSA